MSLVFIPVVVALAGLFGLAFALYGVLTNKKRGGCTGKQQPRQPNKGSSSGNQRTFHRSTTTGCKISLPGQGPNGQCFTCLTLDHDMNNCGRCLTSPADAQQCHAIRLFLWSCEPRSQPLPVLTGSKGITRLALQLGSVELARRWLANWNLAFLDRRASCRPLTISPLSKGSGTLAYLSTHLPPPPGFAASGDWFTMGSVRTVSWVSLPTFEEATGSTRQQASSATVVSSVQATFADSAVFCLEFIELSDSWGPPLDYTVFYDCFKRECWFGFAG